MPLVGVCMLAYDQGIWAALASCLAGWLVLTGPALLAGPNALRGDGDIGNAARPVFGSLGLQVKATYY